MSHTLGIGLVDDVYDPLITKDHVIPHRVVRAGYTTAKDNQTSIFVPVYQGDNPRASQNTPLGQVVIDGLASEKKGTHQFQITFALDADGIFAGEILHVQKGTVKPIKLDPAARGAMTEKKRTSLADIVESGIDRAQGAVAEWPPRPVQLSPWTRPIPVVQLVEEANRLLPGLPADRQRELNDVLGRLHGARATNDTRNVAVLVAQLDHAARPWAGAD